MLKTISPYIGSHSEEQTSRFIQIYMIRVHISIYQKIDFLSRRIKYFSRQMKIIYELFIRIYFVSRTLCIINSTVSDNCR